MRPTPASGQQQQEELSRRDRKSLPKLTVKEGAVHSLQRWMMLTMVSLNTWGSEAARIWENAVQEAKAQHTEWSNMTPHQRALQVGVTDPHFQLPTQLDAMEAQMRADHLSEKESHHCFTDLGLIFQQHMPAESAIRLDGMSAME